MIDRVFSALLTFCVLAGGTAAIASAMADAARQPPNRRVADATVAQLPTVQMLVKRLPAASAAIARAEGTGPTQHSTQ